MTSSISYTARLLNYVEPYYIDGVAKSAFYTEVNTNIKRNDKVFILNGYHDSEEFIAKGKYAKNADGYKVLYADRCKLVLDIDYKGVTSSYTEDDFDKYIKIYHITSQREFDYINRIFIDSYTHSRFSKFEKGYTNNIIYSDSTYFGDASGISINSGLSSTKGFWARIGTTWTNVTNQFNYNTFTFSSNYYAMGLTNNGRFYVVGEDLTYANKTYKQRNIYKYGTASINDWNIDIEYKQPIISKLNFRQGIFKGIHNDGIFGSYLREENWTGTESKWNSGFLVNANWVNGLMKSKSTTSDASYYTIIENGVPIQTTDFSNNKGFGYNYILDSNVYRAQIINGNFINCNVGVTNSGLTAIDDYYGGSNTYSVSTIGGLYNYCNIHSSEVTESTTLDSIIDNSYLSNTRTLNSQLFDSYSSGGEFSINNGVSIVSADIMSYVPVNVGNTTTLSSDIRGVLKLYISDMDYHRLDTFDNFYITKINKDYILSSLDSDQKILLPYETRYVLDKFWSFKVSGIAQECFASLKSKFDNKNKIEVYTLAGLTFSNVISTNDNNYASIDIDLGEYLAFYNASGIYTYINQNIIKKNNVQNLFLKTFISNSDFRNGVVDDIKWTSGSNVNFPSNIIKIESGKLKIAKVSANQISIYLNEPYPTIDDKKLRIGSYVWIDSIHHTSTSGVNTNISGVYKVSNIEYYPASGVASDEAKLTLINSSIVTSLPAGGTYSVLGYLPTYASVNELLINSSEINSGLFVRNLFTNTTFTNDAFNNNDRDLSVINTEKLRLVNQIFKNNNNTVDNGLIYKSHILDLIWNSGISNNSIWNGPTFGGGIFDSGYWENGTFENGYFQNSKNTSLTSIDYDSNTHYKNWKLGTFNNGIFYNSTWLDGIFNNGKLYNSDWYGGIWNNGILGDKNIPTLNTTMAKYVGISATQTLWNDGIVENAQVGGDGIIYWYDGKFNSGVFTSYGSSASKESIWYGGEFNGGDFSDLARWKDGDFNKGKFRSYYGWTMSSSTYSTHYGWENGKFNGGQFGIGSYATNSTWFDGEFNGGIFQGRIWNNGIFLNGNFNGGASTYSVVQDESMFTESFTNSYYGLWRNGWVTNIKHKASTDELISEINIRNKQVEPQKNASLKNLLWVNGIFDHPSGAIENSAWLNGKFKKGVFENGIFNPYVKRNTWDSSFGTHSSFNLSLFDCVWENGIFNSGAFYVSDWYDGKFLNGTMSGARWINGIWEYGYAKNIYWNDGTWKNGMWDGSPFNYENIDTINDMIYSKDRDILLRISNILRNGKVHMINAFTGSYTNELLLSSTPIDFSGWTYSDENATATNWETSGSGLMLNSGAPSNPQIITTGLIALPGSLRGYTLQIGTDVSAGDEFKVYAYFYSNYQYKYGWVTVIADLSDTPSTIAQKLSDKINIGQYAYVVETYQYSYGTYITQWVPWYMLNDNDYYYPSSTYSSTELTVTVRDTASLYGTSLSGGIVGGSYTASEMLYAMVSGPTTSVFTQSDINHSVSLTVSSISGRTDFLVYIGNESFIESIADDTVTYNYSYTPLSSDPPYELGIKRVGYQNPDSSTFILQSASVKTISAQYAADYNNKIYQFATFSAPFAYGITGASVSLPPVLTPYIISDREAVSLKFGNGTFKSGIWEGGYWNNGWRSTWSESESDIVIFTDIVIGGVLETSANTWIIKLQAFNNTNGLSIGDKVSIGNIVCIDVNENRRLINNYYRILAIDTTTITVQISLNMPVRRIVKDSSSHMIYVSKNVWLSGVFHNGYFKGIWNYGLFKGYPYITKMENSHWIDGVFDGGRFISTQSYYLSGGNTYSYNTGLIQNFTFRDNNDSDVSNRFRYNSWIDVNFVTYSMTNLLKDNIRYNYDYGVNISDGNLRGYPTNDVLSSNSVFKNSFDSNYKYYKLGSKYKIYVDYINNGSYFTYPMKTNGLPWSAEFMSNGWTYSNNSTEYHSNTGNNDDGELVIEYTTQSFTNVGIKAVQTRKIIYYNPSDYPSDKTFVAPGTLNKDFSDTNSVYTFHYQDIGGVDTTYGAGFRFSHLSYTASQWQFYNNPNLSPNINTYPVTLRDYPSGNISGLNNNNVLGDTTTSIRRVYMMDWFDVNSMSTQYGGYDNSISTSYLAFGQTTSYGTFSFYAYQAPNTSTLTINALVPFTFHGNERTYRSNPFNRYGWSTFKFVGVVERCGTGSNPYLESNWQYVTSTKLDYYTNNSVSGNGVSLDKDKCCIAWDESMPNGSFIGKLYINNANIQVTAGDLIRFRVYWIDIRKMFCGSDGNHRGPGQFSLSIGVDSAMGYNENNHGYFEIYDTSTYFNTNTNILDNVYTRDIERFRYSVIDFDLNSYGGLPYQATYSVLPTIYLLNDNYPIDLPGNSSVINHALTSDVNKKEYFYNRKSLELFFKSTSDFDAHFGKIKFYETDMIPFFRYTTEENIDSRIKKPIYGVASFINNSDSSISLNSSTFLLAFTQSG